MLQIAREEPITSPVAPLGTEGRGEPSADSVPFGMPEGPHEGRLDIVSKRRLNRVGRQKASGRSSSVIKIMNANKVEQPKVSNLAEYLPPRMREWQRGLCRRAG